MYDFISSTRNINPFNVHQMLFQFLFFFFSAVKCLEIKNFVFVSQDFSVLELAL